eukprot:25452_1
MIGQAIVMILLGMSVSNGKRSHRHHRHSHHQDHWKPHCNHAKTYHYENEPQTEIEPLNTCISLGAFGISRMATCTEEGVGLARIYLGSGCNETSVLLNGTVEELTPSINARFDVNLSIEITCNRHIDCGAVIYDGVILDNQTNETCAAYGNRTDDTFAIVDGACQVFVCDECDDSYSEVMRCTETGAQRTVWESLDCSGKPEEKSWVDIDEEFVCDHGYAAILRSCDASDHSRYHPHRHHHRRHVRDMFKHWHGRLHI